MKDPDMIQAPIRIQEADRMLFGKCYQDGRLKWYHSSDIPVPDAQVVSVGLAHGATSNIAYV